MTRCSLALMEFKGLFYRQPLVSLSWGVLYFAATTFVVRVISRIPRLW